MSQFLVSIADDGLQNLKCTGDPATIIQGRKSFPSGHSSFSFAVGIFTFLYLAGKWKVFASNRSHFSPIRTWRLLFLLLAILGKVTTESLTLISRNLFSFFTVPLCFAISRTCDYHHHWQDVTVGTLLGTLLAIFVYFQHYPYLTHLSCDIPLAMMSQTQTKDDSNLPLLEVETSYD